MTRIKMFLIMIFFCLLTMIIAEETYILKEGVQVVDTFMGIEAEYNYGPVDYEGYNYSCKELVDKFYKKYFGKKFFYR